MLAFPDLFESFVRGNFGVVEFLLPAVLSNDLLAAQAVQLVVDNLIHELPINVLLEVLLIGLVRAQNLVPVFTNCN